jgi:hypothetical protein
MTSQTEGRAGGNLGAGPSPPGVPRALGACARTGRHESRSVPRARPRLGPPPARGGQLGCRLGRETARQAKAPQHRQFLLGAQPFHRRCPLSRQRQHGLGRDRGRTVPSDRSDHARRDGGTRARPRRTGDGRREGDLRDDQAHLIRSIWASRMRPTCDLAIGAPSVPDWATSNGLARPPLSVRSSRVRARRASLAPQFFKPVALGDLLSAGCATVIRAYRRGRLAEPTRARFPRKGGKSAVTAEMLVAPAEQVSRDRSLASRCDGPGAAGRRLNQSLPAWLPLGVERGQSD